ncbi:MAG: acyl-CoA dehydrogenase, partial [Deltaproteobacteria bacterium]
MIDFTFTEEQEMFRKAAREFSETKVAPKVSEMEATGEVCDEVVQALGEAEMMALTIPEKYGGLGLGYIARLISLEEISRVSVATAMMLQVFALGIEPIIKFG